MNHPVEESLEQQIAEREAAGAMFIHPADQFAEESFVHPGEAMDANNQADIVERFKELLTPVFQFIAKGRVSGTLDMRAWVLLYETRLDLVAGESIDSYARSRGVSAPRVYAIIREFRDLIPAYRSSNRNLKTARTRAKMSAAHYDWHDQHAQAARVPPPPSTG